MSIDDWDYWLHWSCLLQATEQIGGIGEITQHPGLNHADEQPVGTFRMGSLSECICAFAGAQSSLLFDMQVDIRSEQGSAVAATDRETNKLLVSMCADSGLRP